MLIRELVSVHTYELHYFVLFDIMLINTVLIDTQVFLQVLPKKSMGLETRSYVFKRKQKKRKKKLKKHIVIELFNWKLFLCLFAQ